jgi:hypothetical protein
MRSFLIGCYPARWRERYGDEFLAILEERPLGPFDVADILLGALDAQLRLRGRDAHIAHGRGFTMSLRIGGIAAIIGAPLWTAGFALAGSGTLGEMDLRVPALLWLVGSIAILVALAGLSAFQARVQPVLSWAAFAIPAVGSLGVILGAIGLAVGRDDLTDTFYLGLMTFMIGSLLFAIATFITGVLSRPAAALLGIAMGLAFASGGGEGYSIFFLIAALACFTVGWMALGAQALRQDRLAITPEPA